MVTATEEGPDLLPATIDLAGTEAHLLTRTGREYVRRSALEDLAQDYDVVLLDCSPSLGVLTVNALTAADEVLIPMQCETLSHRGVRQLLDTVQDVQRLCNRDLKVLGVLPTMYDFFGPSSLEPRWPMSRRDTGWRCCDRRSRNPSASLKHPRQVAACRRPPAVPGAPRPTARSRPS